MASIVKSPPISVEAKSVGDRRRWWRLASGVGLALIWSCSHDVTAPPTVARVIVTPALDTIPSIGGSAQFFARVEAEDGSPLTDSTLTWSVADASVASISPSSGNATALLPGTTVVRATVGSVTGVASLVVYQRPASMVAVAGNDQVGQPDEPLPTPVQVEVRDGGGTPIPGAQVAFAVVDGGGSVEDSGPTNALGRASAVWTLGAAGPQKLVARVGEGLSAEFSATADSGAVVIVSDSLLNAFVSVPYEGQLEARGGTGPYTWTVDDGALPTGMQLSEDGHLEGEPLSAGLFSFTVRAHPTVGWDGLHTLQLRSCAAPPDVSVGAAVTMPPPEPGGCGLFLRSEQGTRYRVGVLRYDVEGGPSASNVVTATVTVTSHAAGTVASAEQRVVTHPPQQVAGVGPEDAIQAVHVRVRADEAQLWARYGTRLRVLGSLQHAATQAPTRFAYDPPRDLNSCVDHTDRVALLVAQNDLVAVYQDSLQRQSLPVSGTAVAELLQFYESYGQSTLHDYTGGLPDVNGDGLLVVLATPEAPNGAAIVWSGDLLDAQTCPGSNQMEITYFDTQLINAVDTAGSDFRAVATLVHEAKHVASFYNRLRNYARTGIANPFQPAWVEEGTAEIVAEAASRRAWAATGGPAIDHAVTAEDLLASGRTPETAQTFLSVERAARYLRRQPNAVTVAPVGGEPTYGIYGSGWQFHRFVADAYYGPGKDAAFFRAQNDSLTAAGIAGLEVLTGKTFPELLEAQAVALMYNGTGVATSAPQYLTYDFASATEAVADGTLGQFPWPVTGAQSRPFSSATFSGPIGESGLRIHDFTSDGTPPGIEIHVAVPEPASLVVVRLH